MNSIWIIWTKSSVVQVCKKNNPYPHRLKQGSILSKWKMDSPWLNSLIRWKNQQEITDTASRISWEQKSVQLGNGHHGWNAKYAYICWISICLSIYLSIDLSVWLSIDLSIYFYLSTYLSIHLPMYIYIYIFIYSLAMQNHKHKYTYINAVWLHIRTCISPFFHHIHHLHTFGGSI